MFRQAMHLGLDWAIATIPTLPVGKGALILIVGGIFAATISLVWTVLMPREVPVRATPTQWPHARRAASQPRPPPVPVRQRPVPRVKAPPPHHDLPRHPRSGPPPGRRARGRARGRDRRGVPGGLAWLGQISMVMEQRGLGEVQPVAIWDEDHCRLRLTDCRSCQGGEGRAGCEAERLLIKNEIERYVAHPRVVEVDCRAKTGKSCIFDVRTGEAGAT